MEMVFVEGAGGPKRLAASGELRFGDDAGPLAGLKLVGFSVWRSTEGEHYVTLPCRPFGEPGDRRYFDLVRPAGDEGGATERLKEWILECWCSRI